MPPENTIKMSIEADIQELKKLEEALEDFEKQWEGKATGVQAPSSGDKMENTKKIKDNHIKILEDLEKNPDLRRAFDKYRDKLFGMNIVDDPEWKMRFERDMKRSASYVVDKYWDEVSKKYNSLERGVFSENKDRLLKAQQIVAEQTGIGPEKIKELMQHGALTGQGMSSKGKEALHTIGLYLVSGLFSQVVQEGFQYMESGMMTEARNLTASGMAFNYNDLTGQAIIGKRTKMENVLRELEHEKMGSIFKGQMIGSGIGTGLGLIAAGLTGGAALPLVGVGMIAGGTIGGAAGSFLGTEDITEEMKRQIPEQQWLQTLAQLGPMINERVSAYQKYNVPDVRFRARFGAGITGRGLGYDSGALRNLQYMMGSIAGYDDEGFLSQLAYSRAYGLSPQDVFSSNISTRFTGQSIGSSEIMGRQRLAEMTGMGQRAPDLIKSLNELSVMLATLNTRADDAGLLSFGLLPNLIYGDSALGRMGDLGMRTISGLQGMYSQEPGSAGDAFLFQSLYPLHKGNLREYETLKNKGIFGEGVFEQTIRSVEEMGTGSDSSFWILNALTGGNIPLSNQLASMIDEKGAETVIQEWLEKTEELSDDTADSKDILGELLSEGKKQTSSTEKHFELLRNTFIEIGGTIADSVQQSNIDLVRTQNEIISKHFREILDTWKESLREMLDMTDVIKTNRENTENEYGSTSYEKNFAWNLGKIMYGGEHSEEFENYVEPLFSKSQNKGKFRLIDEHTYKYRKKPNAFYFLNPYWKKEGDKEYIEIESGFNLFGDQVLEVSSEDEANYLEKVARESLGKYTVEKDSQNSGRGEGISSVSLNPIFVINSSDRSSMHKKIDEYLDDMVADSAQPRKMY